MALMHWDETMSVGVEELDAQHQKLIDLINEAYAAIQKHDEHVMTDLIAKMRDYANLHFSTEEGYLKKYNYPNFEEHKLHHVKFNTDVDEFQKKLYEKTNLSQIFLFLSRWLTKHIMEEDKQYVSYMPTQEAAVDQENQS